MSPLIPADQWLRNHPLSATEIDCVIALMLKILDGKCKMNREDKALTEILYHHCRGRDGERLGGSLHALIAEGRAARERAAQERAAREGIRPDTAALPAALIERIYEQRVLAETMISRPVMKRFKARLRAEGLLPPRPPSA
jgi:hypothetical protein